MLESRTQAQSIALAGLALFDVWTAKSSEDMDQGPRVPALSDNLHRAYSTRVAS
ncbi:hypothetical protein RSAG8_08973, partial [Rhizoctonia solani AG-8 WAC10335]